MEYYAQTEESKEKVRQTSINRYGVKHYSKTKEFVARMKKTNLERFGCETPMDNLEIKEKIKQTNLQKFGCENPYQNEDIKKKIKQVNLDKYGVEYYTQTNEYKIKSLETNIRKYGFKNPTQSKIVRDRMKDTCLKRYGVEYYSQTKEYKERTKQTCLKKYGTEYVMQNPEIKSKSLNRALKVKYINQSFICSQQQLYLYNILKNFTLNYPVYHCILDLAKPIEKIYIEYDGGFHNGRVVMGDMIQEEFEQKEILRNMFLRNKGWKRIRVISNKDWLPYDEIILKMISEAEEYLNSGHTWIEYDIDNKIVKCSQYVKGYDFGKLRKIKKEDNELFINKKGVV